MKTVMDAVNEFKGTWEGDKNYIFEFSSGELCYGGNVTDQTVCTKQEFNDLVSQLEANFGESTAEDYFTWFAMKDSKPNEVNAVTALFAFAGWLTSMEKPITFSSNHWATPAADMVAEMIKLNNIRGVCDFDNIKTPSDFEFPIAIDNGAVDVKPVFTQAMADNGEFPVVGMKLMGRHSEYDEWCEIEVLFVNEDVIYCREHDKIAHYHFSKADKGIQFKPIDTRTDKEKAFDEHFEKSGCDYKYQSILRNAFDAGVKWVGE